MPTGMPTGMPKFRRRLEESDISEASKKRVWRILRKCMRGKPALRRQKAIGEEVCLDALNEIMHAPVATMLRDPLPSEISDAQFLKKVLKKFLKD